MTEVCKDIDIEPQLPPVMGQTFNNRTANTSNEAKVDIQSRGFWVSGHQTFFDARVFDQNTNWYLDKTLPQCYIQNENEKKQQHNERVLEILHGSFNRLLFSIHWKRV